jgi:glycosyltransferase involved in cell wall biosynthesis
VRLRPGAQVRANAVAEVLQQRVEPCLAREMLYPVIQMTDARVDTRNANCLELQRGSEVPVEGLLGAPWTDGEVSPEEIMRRRLAPFDFIQVPYGRSRPIDFARPHFYAQHLDDDELRQFVADAGSAAVDQIPPVPVSAKQPQIPITRATAPAHQIDGVLRRELDAWARAGLTARFWLRDDDAVSDTEELRRLLGLAQEVGITIALAAIPDRADASLARLVADAPCCVWQHGYRHDWRDERECEEFTKGEFGEGRLLKAMTDDAEQGQRALDRVFGPAGWQRVFVPPFHALSISFKAMLPSLGYWGVSAGCPLTPRLDAVAEVNADIDIMNWPERRFMGADSTGAMLVEQLKLRRTGSLPVDRPIGLLTHHPALDDDAWRFLEQLLPFLRSHPSVEFLPVEALFRPSGPAVEASTAPGSAAAQQLADDVTVVITSCNRQDLLEATLDSFLRCNTFPIRQFIVIEDGDGANNQRLIEKYRDLPFTWLATADRVGQVAAIDIAYSEISTDFIFHCEDDWEFTSPGFIEKSLCILKHDDQILQVWLRALTDTNRQPVFDHMFEVEGVSTTRCSAIIMTPENSGPGTDSRGTRRCGGGASTTCSAALPRSIPMASSRPGKSRVRPANFTRRELFSRRFWRTITGWAMSATSAADGVSPGYRSWPSSRRPDPVPGRSLRLFDVRLIQIPRNRPFDVAESGGLEAEFTFEYKEFFGRLQHRPTSIRGITKRDAASDINRSRISSGSNGDSVLVSDIGSGPQAFRRQSKSSSCSCLSLQCMPGARYR